ncbi:hypothetical protein Tco_0385429 [Tanacetum coccineum]
MTTLMFADTHNMVAFLSKPAEMDGKKIIITESTVRRDLQLEYAKGVDCLPNATIFEQLALIGLKTTAWNEFSSTMASAIICLATNQKFNFSKFIFESMVKNLDNVGKFLMYPRPKKKDTQVPQSSVPSDNVADEAVNKELDDTGSQGTTLGGGPRRQETMGDTIAQTGFENVSKLSNDPLLARETTKTTQAEEIVSLKKRVKKLEQKKRSRTHKLKRLRKVGATARVESSGDEEDLVHDLVGDEVVVESEVAVKAGEKRKIVEEVVAVIDVASAIPVSTALKDSRVVIQEPEQDTKPVVEQVKPMKRLEQMRIDKELAFKLQELQLLERFQEGQKQTEDSSKRASTELEQENTKKQKVDDDKETAELQSLMQVIPDEEEIAIDNVPLATKPPTIVDWKIHKEGKNSNYYHDGPCAPKCHKYNRAGHLARNCRSTANANTANN